MGWKKALICEARRAREQRRAEAERAALARLGEVAERARKALDALDVESDQWTYQASLSGGLPAVSFARNGVLLHYTRSQTLSGRVACPACNWFDVRHVCHRSDLGDLLLALHEHRCEEEQP